MPEGGALIDTPGMRELQVWGDGEDLDDAFSDTAELLRGCRFRDCRHGNEPGCAVRQALDAGALGAERYQSCTRLQRELAHLAQRWAQKTRLVERAGRRRRKPKRRSKRYTEW